MMKKISSSILLFGVRVNCFMSKRKLFIFSLLLTCAVGVVYLYWRSPIADALEALEQASIRYGVVCDDIIEARIPEEEAYGNFCEASWELQEAIIALQNFGGMSGESYEIYRRWTDELKYSRPALYAELQGAAAIGLNDVKLLAKACESGVLTNKVIKHLEAFQTAFEPIA